MPEVHSQAEPVNQTVNEKLSVTTTINDEMISKIVPFKANVYMNKSARLADGLVAWEIVNGVLTIHGGQLNPELASENKAPWNSRAGEVTKIVFDGDLVVGDGINRLFANMPNVTSVDSSNGGLVTQGVTSMGSWFRSSKVDAFHFSDWKGWDVAKVTDISYMFQGATNVSLDQIMVFKAIPIKDMASFTDAATVTEDAKRLDLSGWDTSALENVELAFSHVIGLDYLNLNDWNVTHINNSFDPGREPEPMFGGATLKEVEAKNWKWSNAANEVLIEFLSWLPATANLSGWDISDLTDVKYFDGVGSSAGTIDASGWTINSASDLADFFSRASDLTEVDMSNWTIIPIISENKVSMDRMFLHSGSADTPLSVNFTGTDISQVGSMKGMFSRATIKKIDLFSFDTSNVTDMSQMFIDATVTQLDLSHLDTSNVTDMNQMFMNTLTSRLDLSSFNTTKVTNMSLMFANLSSAVINEINMLFENPNLVESTDQIADVVDNLNMAMEGLPDGQPGQLTTIIFPSNLEQWNTSNVVDMGGMFIGNDQLTDLDLANWDTTKVTSMFAMFAFLPSLQSLDLTNWQTSQVIDMAWMFLDDANLKTLDLSSFATNEIPEPDDGINLDTYGMTDMFSGMDNLEKLSVGDNFEFKSYTDHLGTSTVQLPGAQAAPNYFYDEWKSNLGPEVYSADELGQGADKSRMARTYMRVATHAQVVTKDFQTVAGTKNVWKPADTFDHAVDNDQETAISLNDIETELLDADGKATTDLSQPGIYTVNYRFTDANGVLVTATTTFEAKATAAKINLKSPTLTAMPNTDWRPQDQVQSITGANGEVLTADALDTVPVVDTKQPGHYQLEYRYTDAYGNVQTASLDLQVVQPDFDVHDSTLILNQKVAWQATDNFTGLTLDGKPLTLADVTYQGQPDLTKVGSYTVTYTYGDQQRTATINVIASLAQIHVQNSTLKQGDKWAAADNFISAQDAYGHPLTLADVTVSTVDTSQAGQQTVSYRYTDIAGTEHIAYAIVTVVGVPDPVDPEKPIDPTDPIDPEQPVDPETPVNPNPVVPDPTPEVPVAPTKPVVPEKPGKPVIPSNAKPQTIPSSSVKSTGVIKKLGRVTSQPIVNAGDAVNTRQQSLPADHTTTTLPQTNELTQSKPATYLGLALLTLVGIGARLWRKF